MNFLLVLSVGVLLCCLVGFITSFAVFRLITDDGEIVASDNGDG